MISRRPRTTCRCPNSNPLLSSTLLFLLLVLPASSFAQITPDTAPSTALSPSPTTFRTSSLSSSSLSTASEPPAITPTVPPPDPDLVKDHVFNYYFLIIGVVAVLFCFCILYISRQKKRKAAMLRTQSQRALATDVAGFRARFGHRAGRANRGSYNGGSGLDRVEGLDERGEAPPPYVPGMKPPSLHSVAPADEDLELRDMTRPQPVHKPPNYDVHVEESNLDARRPGRSSD